MKAIAVNTRVNETERRYIRTIYVLLSLIIIIDPMLNAFISSTTVLRSLELIALLGIICCELLYLHYFKPFKYKKWILFWIIALGIWSIFIIIRGEFDGLKNSVLSIIGKSEALPYILPFIIFPLPNEKYFKTILNVFFYSSIFAVPLWIIEAFNGGLVRDSYFGEAIGAYLPFFSAFLLVFFNKLGLIKKIITVIIFSAFFVLMLLNARRNVVLSLSLYLLIAIFLPVWMHKGKTGSRWVKILTITTILSCLVILNFSKIQEGLLRNIIDRGFEDTRSQVEISLIADLASSPTSDTVFGRGMDGTYFNLAALQNPNLESDERDRNVVETGYLNMVLKGGIVYVVIILIILISAIVDAFWTKTRILAGIGSILLIYIIALYTSAPISSLMVPAILFWFSVSVALQARVRNKLILYEGSYR